MEITKVAVKLPPEIEQTYDVNGPPVKEHEVSRVENPEPET